MLQHPANAALGPMGCLKHGAHVLTLRMITSMTVSGCG
jgi:hypothetical protein